MSEIVINNYKQINTCLPIEQTLFFNGNPFL